MKADERRWRAHVLKAIRLKGFKAPKGAPASKLKELYKIATGDNPPSKSVYSRPRKRRR